MQTQNYARHTRMDPPFHYVAVPLTLVVLVAAVVDLIAHFSWPALLLAVAALALGITLGHVRRYATGMQDRVIRTEENFRHHVLTGAQLDPRLTRAQIIALRFAGDAEFPALAARAAQEGLSPDAIKRAVTQWRADDWRV